MGGLESDLDPSWSAPMTTGLRDAVRGLRRILREATGEAKWDDYLADCTAAGIEPTTRSVFERHRADRRECGTPTRCC